MLLWDCKREALRGLGVNTGHGGEHNSPPLQIMARKFLSQLKAVSIVSWPKFVMVSWICCEEFTLPVPESYCTES